VTDLTAVVQAHRTLAAQIREAFPEEDEVALADSIDAATELDAAILAVLRAALEREAMAEALGGMIKQMSERKRRLEEGAAGMRAACLQAMLNVGWKRLPAAAPDLTVTVGNGRPKVIVTDEAALPCDLVEIVAKPNKKAIAAALAAGRGVPGAVLGNAEPHLIVSRR